MLNYIKEDALNLHSIKFWKCLRYEENQIHQRTCKKVRASHWYVFPFISSYLFTLFFFGGGKISLFFTFTIFIPLVFYEYMTMACKNYWCTYLTSHMRQIEDQISTQKINGYVCRFPTST
jgi:hypothetical protein